MANNSIRLIGRTLSGAAIPGKRVPRSDWNERALRITQNSSIIEDSPSDCSVPYPGHSLGGGVLPLRRDAVGVFCSSS